MQYLTNCIHICTTENNPVKLGREREKRMERNGKTSIPEDIKSSPRRSKIVQKRISKSQPTLTQTLSRSQIRSPSIPPALASWFSLSTSYLEGQTGRSVVEIRFTSVYWTNIRGYSLLICHSKPASIAPGSFDGAAGAGAGGRGAVGMLTNCSLMNSFNLQIKWSKQSGKLLKLKYNSRIGLWG